MRSGIIGGLENLSLLAEAVVMRARLIGSISIVPFALLRAFASSRLCEMHL
jgi:hypothetical protein